MEKEIENTDYLNKISAQLGEISILNTISMRPGYHNISELGDLEKDKKRLIYKLDELQDLRKTLCIRLRENNRKKEEILSVVHSIYENGEKGPKCVELRVMHDKIRVLRKENLIISDLLKQVKRLGSFIKNGLGGIDYIKRNSGEIKSFYVSIINRFYITLYNKIKN